MSEVVYRSQVRIEKDEGPNRRAWLPGREDPITFGVHGEIAEHYGLPEDAFAQHTATLDYVVAAAGG